MIFERWVIETSHLSWQNKHLKFSMLKIQRLNIGLSLFRKKQIDPNEENLSNLNIVVTHPFRRTINVDEVPQVDDVYAIREDHDEGIYI